VRKPWPGRLPRGFRGQRAGLPGRSGFKNRASAKFSGGTSSAARQASVPRRLLSPVFGGLKSAAIDFAAAGWRGLVAAD